MFGNMMMGCGMDRFMMRRFEKEYAVKEILFKLAKGTDSSKQIARNVKVAFEYANKMEKAMMRERRLAEIREEYREVLSRIKDLGKRIPDCRKLVGEDSTKYEKLMEAKVKDVKANDIEYAKGTLNNRLSHLKELEGNLVDATKRLTDVVNAWKGLGQKEKDLNEEKD